jgi:mevalonate kinase
MIMKRRQDIFYAKIMLFGEYSVICDSMGLTIPYAHFTGELSFINNEQYTEYDFAVESNRHLRDYLVYLRELMERKRLAFDLDIKRMEQDIDNGLYFESNIPQGYGIGSSGALVAALYDTYSGDDTLHMKVLTPRDIMRMKEIFAQMESYFHGVSSGLDPLLCYIKYPLLIRNRNEIETVGIPRNKFPKNGAIFLIDTERVGKTGPLVKLFFDRCNDEDFMHHVHHDYIPANNACIHSLLEGDFKAFFPALDDLSEFQYHFFKEMIPEDYHKYWNRGLEGDDFKLKLCGSGGGGFLLGIARNYEKAKKYFDKEGVETIPVYKTS